MSDDGILGLAEEPMADGVECYRTVERPFSDPTRRLTFLTGDAINFHTPDFPRDAEADVSRGPRGR